MPTITRYLLIGHTSNKGEPTEFRPATQDIKDILAESEKTRPDMFKSREDAEKIAEAYRVNGVGKFNVQPIFYEVLD